MRFEEAIANADLQRKLHDAPSRKMWRD